MNRLIVTTLALITGFFTLVFALVMAIPLAIVALITGKRLQKQMQNQMNAYSVNEKRRTPFSDAGAFPHTNTIDGEFEEVNR
ncbi:hypothetical protein [Vibrio genomosp. F10]|uniref:hypothetical protein n=1 Tax=Vibrio genomosp. F10 TaxID=723171 RepID=UPI00030EF941|nr:hypothetical protein [Vibrio genomosp. F10]OEF05080.1 hypothetical protein A1QI_09105 [Vibrio genomosp. F10 str. 9ZB36]